MIRLQKDSYLHVLTFLWCMAILCLHHVQAEDPVLDPAKVEDKYGNTADSDSNITWADLPQGTPYKTDTEYHHGGLLAFYNMCKGFLAVVQPNEFPSEIVTGLLKGTFNLGADYMQVINYSMGFGVCAVIGFLFIFIFPIVGCCFCCCRCCGNCGGKRMQKKDNNTGCKRYTYSAILFGLTALIATGAACSVVTTDKLTSVIYNVYDMLDGNVHDVMAFMNNTVKAAEFVALEDFRFTRDVITRDLKNIGVIVGIPLRDRVDSDARVTETINNITGFDSVISDVISELDKVNTTSMALQGEAETLSLELKNVSDQLRSIPGMGAEADQLTMDSNFSNFPDLSEQRQKLQDSQGTSLSDLMAEGVKKFQDIPAMLTNQTQSMVDGITQQLDSFITQMEGMVDQIAQFSQLLEPVKDITGMVKTYLDILTPYEQYRIIGCVGLMVFVLFIILFQLLGLLFGLCGSGVSTPDTKRGCLSNSGGNFLIAAVAFIFMCSSFYMLLTTITFLIGGNIEKAVCEPIKDPDMKLIKTFLDDPKTSVFGNTSIGELLFQDGSINLTITGILKSCQDNKPLLKVIPTEKFFNLSTITNYKQSMDIESQLDGLNVNLDDLKLLTPETETQLRDLSKAAEIDFSSFISELEKNTTTVDLESFANDLRTKNETPLIQAQLNNLANDLDNIKDGSLQRTKDKQAQLLNNIRSLEAVTGVIGVQINATIDSVQGLESVLQNRTSTIAKEEALNFVNRIFRVLDSFMDFAINAIYNDIGKCKPLWDVWEFLVHILLCGYVVDSLNGFWFSLGWSVFFMVPAVIFNVKLAKHFRRMNIANEQSDPYTQQNQASPPPPYNNGPHITTKIGKNKVGHTDWNQC